jgi:hypothetical protein
MAERVGNSMGAERFLDTSSGCIVGIGQVNVCRNSFRFDRYPWLTASDEPRTIEKRSAPPSDLLPAVSGRRNRNHSDNMVPDSVSKAALRA